MTNIRNFDTERMDQLLADAKGKGWKVLERYKSDDGWLTGNVIEYVVLMKGMGCLAELAHVHLSSGTNKAHLMRQCESGGSAYWEPK
tara:strand:- start:669 stop:929 length:261 start_codon:yes stop_codon:yes gene_type:complete